MLIENRFTVPATPERVWDLLIDLGAVGSCLPGASVEVFDGETVTGAVTVRIGPMSLAYGGEARFVMKDEEHLIATIEGRGRDRRGGGSVTARIKVTLTEAATGTDVHLATDLGLTGRVAQLGQGPINDVSAALMEQFADCLARRIEEPADVHPGGDGPALESRQAPEPVNLLSRSAISSRTVGLGLVGVAGVVAAVVAAWAVRRWLRTGAVRS